MLSSLIPIIFAIIFFIVMCMYIFLYKNLKNKIHQISDNVPETKTGQAYAMQLGDELKDYIKEKDGKLYLKVVKE